MTKPRGNRDLDVFTFGFSLRVELVVWHRVMARHAAHIATSLGKTPHVNKVASNRSKGRVLWQDWDVTSSSRLVRSTYVGVANGSNIFRSRRANDLEDLVELVKMVPSCTVSHRL
jgi:hypothetical protein